MKKFAMIAGVAALMLSSAAQASCYSARELEAEQGLRIHSELMVIGLTCLKMPGGQGLYGLYQKFTQKNSGLITQYEDDIIDYYRASGAAEPEKKLHTLRTNLANRISVHAVNMSTKSFCDHFGQRVYRALEMDQGKIRRWARHVWRDTPVSQPLCAGL